MKKIFKYKLPESLSSLRFHPMELPKGSKFLDTREQYGYIVVYALVDPDTNEIERYDIIVAGTGQTLPEDILDYAFLGTVKTRSGAEMWHVFYKKID